MSSKLIKESRNFKSIIDNFKANLSDFLLQKICRNEV